MAISDVIMMLEAERNKLDAAIKALKGTETVSSSASTEAVKNTGKKWKISAAVRAKMAQAARERWAKKKAASKKAEK
jgi:hypothetical protein